MYLCDSKATERINEFSYIRLLLHYFITPEADATERIDKRLPKH